ncbi:hypothetical protein BGZ70_005969 [Mortierella alpina]|uniref:Uncharacterized protein n=1 Tax=Mortierella alpina TaxID=64518 RepID=A0A9P6M3B4_MORAP|nr:hypothetical protein BGZ70_005969 [Mortierella alpina]
MDSSTHDSPLSNPPISASAVAITAHERLLAACPCLNIKLHLATEPGANATLSGKETKLGLAGVSVEQKILCCLSTSKDLATVRCINCNEDVYTFQPSSNSVTLESTSLAFLASSVLFSPSNGIVVPSASVIYGHAITELVNGPHYSKAFRLILTPPTSSGPATTAFSQDAPTSTGTTATTATSTLYRPHLEKVRAILEKELEVNLNSQRTRTEARIEAFKSQQLFALQQSIENTKQEKERLWSKIQERVAPPPPASVLNVGEIGSERSADVNGAQHPFDGPSTLPVRLTSASRVEGAHGSFLDRRRGSVSDMAMSLQFREFDQRMASNSSRRQSLVPPTAMGTNDLTLANTAANAAVDRSLLSTSHNSETSITSAGAASPSQKSKKKVTIADSVRSVSIVEPQEEEDEEGNDSGSEEVEDEEGVVFDLDEELGFDEDDSAIVRHVESDEASQESDFEDQEQGTSTNGNGVAINITSLGRSLPQQGMVVGSLRANYLRRQKGLEQQKKSLYDDTMEFDSDEDEDANVDNFNSRTPPAFFGTSLPIQIQSRPTMPPPPPPTRTSAIAGSLALPPGSSPAAAMLQRRLSRAYGADGLPETTSANNNNNNNNSSSRPGTSGLAGSYNDVFSSSPSLQQPTLGTTPGTLILDPLMLLEEEHDNDDRQDRARKHRQPFSSINHRRDLLEKRRNEEQQQQDAPMGGSVKSSSVTQQSDFEPPHLYSARTYVGSTPWEMPTRITVKSGGMQREGTNLDKQIALEMAKELEKERQELMVDEVIVHGATMGVNVSHRVVDKIDEAEEEEDQEDQDKAQERQDQFEKTAAMPSQHPHEAAALSKSVENDTAGL